MKLRWLWVVAMLVGACGDSSTTPRSEEAPEWLKQLIVRLEAEPVAYPPAVIAQYRYLGGTVYYLAPRCCDVPSELYSVALGVLWLVLAIAVRARSTKKQRLTPESQRKDDAT